jgi:hypothetical protein
VVGIFYENCETKNMLAEQRKRNKDWHFSIKIKDIIFTKNQFKASNFETKFASQLLPKYPSILLPLPHE